MNTRIEVPVTLPPPHFDDERTIATARRVKPIGRAKVSESWRKVRTLLPLMFLATLCGALGATAVNYYERRQGMEVQTPQQSQVNNAVPVQTKSEPTPLAIAASAGVNGSKAFSESKAAELEQATTKSNEQLTQPEPGPSPADQPSNAFPKPEKKSADSDAAKLTRKRRVQPVEDATPPAQKNGAARISDIFSGPNP